MNLLFADSHPKLLVTPWSILPFVAILLCIAILPLAAEKWWHSNLRKALVSVALAAPVIAYLLYLGGTMNAILCRLGAPVIAYLLYLQRYDRQPVAIDAINHVAFEYVDFICLLAALFTVTGGIAVQGQFRPTPLINAGFLLLGAVLANLIGTTGASILLVRPLLRINIVRKHRSHLPIFFIFVVSNLGGLLTPLGDPPLLLGFLRGVDFFWTLSLWPHWLVANGAVILIAFGWDTFAYWREPDRSAFPPRHGSMVIGGSINVVFLVGILAAVLLQSELILGENKLTRPWPNLIMLGMAVLSWLFTARTVREHNDFSWEPIIEVAVIFAGIFATMIPALALLSHHRKDFGISEPWQFFWLTGMLSSWLDNAPTYVAFATLAADGKEYFGPLSVEHPHILQAISAGAVFMGANTYIGNGPNFMVKSLAEHMGYRMPSFFGYILYSSLILLPVFGLVTWLFFLD